MALTLADAQDLSNDLLLQGVYATILNNNDSASFYAWRHVVGNGVRYNREGTLAGANVATVAWRAVGATWTEDVSTYTPVTVDLKILGGDADVDRFLANSMSNVNDLDATIIMGKANAHQRELDDTFINGSGAGDEPSGLNDIIVYIDAGGGSQTIGASIVGANGFDPDTSYPTFLNYIEQMIDLCRPFPDLLVMSRRTRRHLNSAWRASGASMETREYFGRFIQLFNGIPIAISDYISDAQTLGTSNDCSIMYAVYFGLDKGGFEWLFSGPSSTDPIQVEDIGVLETKDAYRYRVKSYVAPALYSSRAASRLIGIRA